MWCLLTVATFLLFGQGLFISVEDNDVCDWGDSFSDVLLNDGVQVPGVATVEACKETCHKTDGCTGVDWVEHTPACFVNIQPIVEHYDVNCCEPVNPETKIVCKEKIDLAIVIDGSTSICGPTACAAWESMVEFIHNIIDSLEVGPDAAKISVIVYSTEVTSEFDLNAYTDKESLLQAVGSLMYPTGNTNTTGALVNLVTKTFSPVSDTRPEVPNIAILITDGNPNTGRDQLPQAIEAVRRNDILMFVVGVTVRVDEEVLAEISSYPHMLGITYFMTPSFSALETVREKLTKQTCTEAAVTHPRPTPTKGTYQTPPTTREPELLSTVEEPQSLPTAVKPKPPPTTEKPKPPTPTEKPKIPPSAPPTKKPELPATTKKPELLPSTKKPTLPPPIEQSVPPTAIKPPEPLPKTEAPETETGCSVIIDLAFVVDGSTSICSGAKDCSAWKENIDFIKNIIDGFKIGSDATRVGLVLFADKSSVEFDLSAYTNKKDLLKAVDGLKYPQGGTNTTGALKSLTQSVFTAAGGDRPIAPNVALVITDGKPNTDVLHLKKSVDALQAIARVLAIGVTKEIEERDLKSISSPPKQRGVTFFQSGSYASLGDIVKDVLKQACST